MRTSDNKKRLPEIEIFSLEHWIFMFTKVNVMVESKPLDDRNKRNGLIGSKSCYSFFLSAAHKRCICRSNGFSFSKIQVFLQTPFSFGNF